MDLPRGLAGVVIDQTSISSTKNAKLTYSGYPIEEICQASFEEVVYLLWYGRLPNKEELQKFRKLLVRKMVCRQKPFDFCCILPANRSIR